MNNYALFPNLDGHDRAVFDDELQQEINECFGWDNQYDGGFVYAGDHSEYEGLTIIDHPHIDACGTVSAIPLYNHE